MFPLRYRHGQVVIKEEVKTTHIAEKLANWVGPVAEFALGADLLLLATAKPDNTLGFTVLSGTPSLVEVLDEPSRRIRYQPGELREESDLRICFRPNLMP